MLFASDKETIEYAQEVLLPAMVPQMPCRLVDELCWPQVSHLAALHISVEAGVT